MFKAVLESKALNYNKIFKIIILKIIITKFVKQPNSN